ncbi:MAG TPA: AbrB/MazE/SpoVT family DNA-binding domain-containing protein [Thermoanaerobaculia bacterium]|jgi:AbrB family looped-hinge helix DNA binding protein|nr:AbrB/MazE/SpoVT family DNA-binding domain-containing protein [Thermoanaerobaculia bacterium]
MPTSTIITKGRTTVPKEIRDALDLHPGDQLHWEINSGHVTITKRPAFFRWKGVIKDGPSDVVQAVIEARKTRGRI